VPARPAPGALRHALPAGAELHCGRGRELDLARRYDRRPANPRRISSILEYREGESEHFGTWDMDGERTILVVDDEPDILDLASSFLKDAGYRSLAAANADIALIIMNQPEISFDLLITDIIMPGTMDGISLALEASRLLPMLPIVYMTGFSGIADVRAREAPLGVVLNKPWSRQQFLHTVGAALAAAPVVRHDENAVRSDGRTP
jgi:CheY-like chemotaxis protein